LRVFTFERDHTSATLLKLMAIVIPVSLLLGWLSYRFVETPLRRWARALEPREAAGRSGLEVAASRV
jgi:peptidoglycan/LPS O-acetylase OafA/YrhL